jgi:hypothetical protein
MEKYYYSVISLGNKVADIVFSSSKGIPVTTAKLIGRDLFKEDAVMVLSSIEISKEDYDAFISITIQA